MTWSLFNQVILFPLLTVRAAGANANPVIVTLPPLSDRAAIGAIMQATVAHSKMGLSMKNSFNLADSVYGCWIEMDQTREHSKLAGSSAMAIRPDRYFTTTVPFIDGCRPQM